MGAAYIVNDLTMFLLASTLTDSFWHKSMYGKNLSLRERQRETERNRERHRNRQRETNREGERETDRWRIDLQIALNSLPSQTVVKSR